MPPRNPHSDEDSDEFELDDGLAFEDESEDDEDERDAEDTLFDDGEDEDEDEEAEYWESAGVTAVPKDYYFNATASPDAMAPVMILITPKKYFDAEGCQWDGHISQEAGGPLDLDPYEELMEGTFAPADENATVASVERDLRARGLIHNPNL